MFRPKPEITPDVATPFEARPIIVQHQHEGHGRQRADAVNGLNGLVSGYARAFSSTRRSYAAMSSVKVWTKRIKGSNADRNASGQPSVAFRANVSVGEAGSRWPVDFTIPRTAFTIFVRVWTATSRARMSASRSASAPTGLNRREERRPDVREARQQARVRAIMLRIALRNQPQLPRIRHQHLVVQRVQQAADPGRMCPASSAMRIRPFPSNNTRNDASVVFTAPSVTTPPLEIQHTVGALPIADIQPHDRLIPRPDRGRSIVGSRGCAAGDVDSGYCLHHGAADILRHGWSP